MPLVLVISSTKWSSWYRVGGSLILYGRNTGALIPILSWSECRYPDLGTEWSEYKCPNLGAFMVGIQMS